MTFEQCRAQIETLSGGRVALRKYEEYQLDNDSCEIVREFAIASKQDISHIRSEVDQLFEKVIPCWRHVRWPILLTLSEAVTNVVKHTPGGRLLVGRHPNGLCFHIIDNGHGIDLERIPLTLFGKGYSTSASMGMGFPIMIKYVDKITLYTSERGTILILRFELDSECM